MALFRQPLFNTRLAGECQRIAETRRTTQTDFCRRIPDLAPGGATAKLSTKLNEWWKLADFKALQTEVKKQFRLDIPLAERNAWEDWFARQKTAVDARSTRLAALEAELDRAVYALFKLDALAAAPAPCDDSAHDPGTTATDRATPDSMARPPRGRGQPAHCLSQQGAGLHPQHDGAGKRACRSGAAEITPESTRPLDATRELATAAGPLPYSEVAERLAANIVRCIDALLELAPEDIAFTPEWIREVHGRIAGELFPGWAGRFRSNDVQVGTHLPPPGFEVALQTSSFCLDLAERLEHLDGVESIADLLAWADWRFQWIHPFKDFNGRVGRILLIALCYKLGLPPVDPAMAAPDKSAYFEALRAADAGDLDKLRELWLVRLGA